MDDANAPTPVVSMPRAPLAAIFAEDDAEVNAADAAFTYKPAAPAGQAQANNQSATESHAQNAGAATATAQGGGQKQAAMAHGCALAHVYVDNAPAGVAGAALLYHDVNQTVTLLVYDPNKRPLVAKPLHSHGDDALAPQKNTSANDGVYVSFSEGGRRWSLLYRAEADWVAFARNAVLLRAAASKANAVQAIAGTADETALIARHGDTVQARVFAWRVPIAGNATPVLVPDASPFHESAAAGSKLDLAEGQGDSTGSLVLALEGCPKGARRAVAIYDADSLVLWDVEVLKLKKRRGSSLSGGDAQTSTQVASSPAEAESPSLPPLQSPSPQSSSFAAESPPPPQSASLADDSASSGSLAERMARVSAMGGRGGMGIAMAINPRARSMSAGSESAVSEEAAEQPMVPAAEPGVEPAAEAAEPVQQQHGEEETPATKSHALSAATSAPPVVSSAQPTTPPSPLLPDRVANTAHAVTSSASTESRTTSPAWWYGPCVNRADAPTDEASLVKLTSRVEETHALVHRALGGAISAAITARGDSFLAETQWPEDDLPLVRGDVERLLRDAFEAAAETARRALAEST